MIYIYTDEPGIERIKNLCQKDNTFCEHNKDQDSEDADSEDEEACPVQLQATDNKGSAVDAIKSLVSPGSGGDTLGSCSASGVCLTQFHNENNNCYSNVTISLLLNTPGMLGNCHPADSLLAEKLLRFQMRPFGRTLGILPLVDAKYGDGAQHDATEFLGDILNKLSSSGVQLPQEQKTRVCCSCDLATTETLALPEPFLSLPGGLEQTCLLETINSYMDEPTVVQRCESCQAEQDHRVTKTLLLSGSSTLFIKLNRMHHDAAGIHKNT